MAAKDLPKIRAGMGDVGAAVVEAWSDDDYRRATGLATALSADGKADRAAVPALAPAALRECYRTMLRIRALGERRAAAPGADPGAVPLATRGWEAAIVGAVSALEADDLVVPGRREAAAALWRGHSLAALAADAAIPRALAVLPASPHGATHLPHATGIAWAMKMQAQTQGSAGAGKVALAYLDREGTSAEDFHAGLNFAGVFHVPAVFVCTDDGAGRAASSGSVETVSETMAVKALAYGLGGVRVDGNDLFAVHGAVRAAAARARAGGGPTLVEAALGQGGDPLDRVMRWLTSEGILDAAGESALRREVEAEAEAAVGKA
jgi:pyruvate dehydrogenase E1 component alpha subunit